jgi:hypothetical protein
MGTAAFVGVSTFRAREIRPGWTPSMPRGGGVLPGGVNHPPGACHLTVARPAPRSRIPPAGVCLTRRHRRFTGIRPSGLPLACRPRVEQGLLGFSPELRTPPLPATHVQVGTGYRTRTRDYPVTGDIADPLSKSVHSTPATSCRTFTRQVSFWGERSGVENLDHLKPAEAPVVVSAARPHHYLRIRVRPHGLLSRIAWSPTRRHLRRSLRGASRRGRCGARTPRSCV